MKYWVLVVLLAPSVLACVVPQNGMRIDRSIEFCSDVYYFDKGLVISGNNIMVNCNSAILKSWNGNEGILIVHSNNVTVVGCRVLNYQTGIFVRNSTSVYLRDNHLIKNEVGTRFDLVSDSATLNHDVSLRMPFELIASRNNAVSLLNKRVSGSFCAENFCNERRNAVVLFVQPKTAEPEMSNWLLEQLTGKKSAQRLFDWVFGGLSTPEFVQR